MDSAELRRKLESWDLPLGPFRELEDIEQEMRETALEMGLGAAPVLADLAITIESDQSSYRQEFLNFSEFSARLFPDALATALLERLTPNGPSLLVLALGPTGSADASSRLMSTLDLGAADDDLLESLASTLGEIGDSKAIEALRMLQKRPNLSKGVRDEIKTALWDSDKR
jgi:hypothetical protein